MHYVIIHYTSFSEFLVLSDLLLIMINDFTSCCVFVDVSRCSLNKRITKYWNSKINLHLSCVCYAVVL